MIDAKGRKMKKYDIETLEEGMRREKERALELIEKCKDCGKDMKTGKLNQKYFIAYCDNPECNKGYRNAKKRGRKMTTKEQTNKLCCSKGIREDCECYQEGMKRERDRILMLIDKQLNACKVLRKPLSTRTNDKIWYAQRVLEELKQKIKEQEK